MDEMKTENTVPKIIKKQSEGKLNRLPKAVRPFLVGLVIVFMVCCIVAVYQMTNSSSVVITLNSDSVSKGQNPDGTPFDIYQILSDEVLAAAVEKLDGKITVAELKRHLSVSDALTAQTNQQLKQSIRDGEYENVYFPTVYRITYSTVSDQLRSEGIGRTLWEMVASLTYPGKNRILAAVSQSYQEIYEEDFLSYDGLFDVDWAAIDAMDYYNRAEALRTETTRVLRFLQDKSNKNPAAGASAVKLTFGDLRNDLFQLINVDIENHQAYIIQNSITTSRSELLRQFRYMEELYIEENERRTEEYLILDEAVDMYDSTTTKVVFIPALDQNDSFYMNRTKVGLDYLVESADAARLAADEAEHDAQYYKYLQTCFADAVIPQQSQITHADEGYLSIKGKFVELLSSVKQMLAEHNQTENEGIKISNPGATVGIVGVGMSFAKRFVILSLAAYVLICVGVTLSKKKKSAATQEV